MTRSNELGFEFTPAPRAVHLIDAKKLHGIRCNRKSKRAGLGLQRTENMDEVTCRICRDLGG